MMSKTILALIWGDDHLNLNGGAWQFLSGPNIYFQLLVVLTEIKFILRIKYSTDFFYFLLFSGRPWLFIFYGTMARIFIFKLFGPEYLFTKFTSPLPSDSNGRPFMAYSKLFFRKQLDGRGEGEDRPEVNSLFQRGTNTNILFIQIKGPLEDIILEIYRFFLVQKLRSI